MGDSNNISKVELLEFVKDFHTRWGKDYMGLEVWSVKRFAEELEIWLAVDKLPEYRITIKRLGLTVGSVDINRGEPTPDEVIGIVKHVLPDYDPRIDVYELKPIG